MSRIFLTVFVLLTAIVLTASASTEPLAIDDSTARVAVDCAGEAVACEELHFEPMVIEPEVTVYLDEDLAADGEGQLIEVAEALVIAVD